MPRPSAVIDRDEAHAWLIRNFFLPVPGSSRYAHRLTGNTGRIVEKGPGWCVMVDSAWDDQPHEIYPVNTMPKMRNLGPRPRGHHGAYHLDDLQRWATKQARAQGHVLGHWTAHPEGAGHTATATCVHCGASAHVHDTPDTAQQGFGGQAVVAPCRTKHRPAPRGQKEGLGTPWGWTRRVMTSTARTGSHERHFWTIEMPPEHRSGALAFRVGMHPFEPGFTVDKLPRLGPWESYFPMGRDVFPSPEAAAQALVAELHATHRW